MSTNSIAIFGKIRRRLNRIQAKGITASDEIFLTSDQMERQLCCRPSTLYRLRKNGTIPCVKVGVQYRYLKLFFTDEVIKSIRKHEGLSKRLDE